MTKEELLKMGGKVVAPSSTSPAPMRMTKDELLKMGGKIVGAAAVQPPKELAPEVKAQHQQRLAQLQAEQAAGGQKAKSTLAFLPKALGETAVGMAKGMATPFTRTAGTVVSGAASLIGKAPTVEEGKAMGMFQPYETKKQALAGAAEIGLQLTPETREVGRALKSAQTYMKGRTMLGLGKPVQEKASDLMLEALGGGKSLIQKMEVRRGKSLKDVASFMAKEKSVPSVSGDGKLSWEAARMAQEEAMKADEKLLQSELTKTPRTVSVSWARIAGKAKENLNQIFKNALERKEASDVVDELVNAERQSLGVQPSLNSLNESKRGMWQVGYVKGDAKQALRSKVARQLGHAISEEIAAKSGNKNIKVINDRMGMRADAMTAMETTEGNVVKGGKLGKYVAGAAGAMAGSHVPVVGPIAGFYGGMRAQEYLAKQAPVKAAKAAAKLMSRVLPEKELPITKKIITSVETPKAPSLKLNQSVPKSGITNDIAKAKASGQSFDNLYHGSSSEFSKFDTAKIGTGEGGNKFGPGAYLTDNKEIADFYAKTVSKKNFVDKVSSTGIFGTDVPTYKPNADELASKIAKVNVFKKGNLKFLDTNTLKVEGDLRQAFVEAMSSRGWDKKEAVRFVDEAVSRARTSSNKINDFRNEFDYVFGQLVEGDKTATEKVMASIKKRGFDGIKFPSDKSYEGLGSSNYLVFDPTKITK